VNAPQFPSWRIPLEGSAALRAGSPCPRCRLSHNQPELQSCPLCGYEIAKFAALGRSGAKPREAPAQPLAGGIPPALRVYYLTDSLTTQCSWPLVLIRVAIGLALLAVVLRACVQATGSVPYVPSSISALMPMK
jgi:hypothetical protein